MFMQLLIIIHLVPIRRCFHHVKTQLVYALVYIQYMYFTYIKPCLRNVIVSLHWCQAHANISCTRTCAKSNGISKYNFKHSP